MIGWTADLNMWTIVHLMFHMFHVEQTFDGATKAINSLKLNLFTAASILDGYTTPFLQPAMNNFSHKDAHFVTAEGGTACPSA
jgi:hypothetical protein